MAIGIRGHRQTREVSWLRGILALPFRGKISGYVINRRQWANGQEADESTE
jgi:hypothetical protein